MIAKITTAVVTLGTLMLVLAAFVFIDRYAGPSPIQDDFAFLGHQLYPEVPKLEHLLSPLNEHRLPLPRLIVWATARTFGFSLRTQMFVNLAIVVVALAALLALVRVLRGRWSFADVALPAAFMSLGQYESLLWSVQVNFWLPVALATMLLVLVAWPSTTLTNRRVLGISACLFLLPLCGGQGIVVAAPVVVWLLVVGIVYRRFVAIACGDVRRSRSLWAVVVPLVDCRRRRIKVSYPRRCSSI